MGMHVIRMDQREMYFFSKKEAGKEKNGNTHHR
jgi:hypothetical protein